jgi:quinol monooxygenase YgiN
MITKGLLVRLEVKPDKDEDVERFMKEAVEMVRAEPLTTAWFAIRFGRSEYGIFDVFPDEEGRNAHMKGAVAGVLKEKSGEYFTRPPQIQKLDVIAAKLPIISPVTWDTKGLLLTFKAKSGHEQKVEEFLRSCREYIDEEPETSAWFAIHLETGEYGIFDVFADKHGRTKHLTGKIPLELLKHSLNLLGSIPDMDKVDVLEEKL